MFGFCFMLVPLYALVCKQTGINGKVFGAVAIDPNMMVDKSRTITVQFSTTLHENLLFKFKPLVKHIELHPGETKTVYFYAENNTGRNIVVQAIPSISPGEAARYLKKTQCFCFTQQKLLKGEKVDMPVVFHLDPGIHDDVHVITLNYTLFDATDFARKDVKHFTEGRIEL